MDAEFGWKALWGQSERIGAPQAANCEVFARLKTLVKGWLFWYKQ
jgi:hypothetical protein